MKKFYIEFVGSLPVRWGIELESISHIQASKDARLSLPESGLEWSLGDDTNPVIDVEMVGCTEVGEPEIRDRDLGLLELEAKYDDDFGEGEHPSYTRALWKHCVAENETVSGYWYWVYHKLQCEEVASEPNH